MDSINEAINTFLDGMGAHNWRQIAAEALYGVCSIGHLGAVKFIAETFRFTASEPEVILRALSVACENRNLHITTWLKDTYSLKTADDARIALKGCELGRVDMVRYLLPFYDFPEDAIREE